MLGSAVTMDARDTPGHDDGDTGTDQKTHRLDPRLPPSPAYFPRPRTTGGRMASDLVGGGMRMSG